MSSHREESVHKRATPRPQESAHHVRSQHESERVRAVRGHEAKCALLPISLEVLIHQADVRLELNDSCFFFFLPFFKIYLNRPCFLACCCIFICFLKLK